MCPLQRSVAVKSPRQRGPGTCYDYKEKACQNLSRSTGRLSTLLHWVGLAYFGNPLRPALRAPCKGEVNRAATVSPRGWVGVLPTAFTAPCRSSGSRCAVG